MSATWLGDTPYTEWQDLLAGTSGVPREVEDAFTDYWHLLRGEDVLTNYPRLQKYEPWFDEWFDSEFDQWRLASPDLPRLAASLAEITLWTDGVEGLPGFHPEFPLAIANQWRDKGVGFFEAYEWKAHGWGAPSPEMLDWRANRVPPSNARQLNDAGFSPKEAWIISGDGSRVLGDGGFEHQVARASRSVGPVEDARPTRRRLRKPDHWGPSGSTAHTGPERDL